MHFCTFPLYAGRFFQWTLNRRNKSIYRLSKNSPLMQAFCKQFVVLFFFSTRLIMKHMEIWSYFNYPKSFADWTTYSVCQISHNCFCIEIAALEKCDKIHRWCDIAASSLPNANCPKEMLKTYFGRKSSVALDDSALRILHFPKKKSRYNLLSLINFSLVQWNFMRHQYEICMKYVHFPKDATTIRLIRLLLVFVEFCVRSVIYVLRSQWPSQLGLHMSVPETWGQSWHNAFSELDSRKSSITIIYI